MQLEKLCSECYGNIIEIERKVIVKDYFLKGIPQRFLAFIVSNPALKTSQEIVEVIDQFRASENFENCQVMKHSETNENTMKIMEEQIKKLTDQVQNLAVAFNPEHLHFNKQPDKCWNCQCAGHISRFCPSPNKGKEQGSS